MHESVVEKSEQNINRSCSCMLVVFGLLDQTEPLSIIVFTISHEVAHNFHSDSNTVSRITNRGGWISSDVSLDLLGF